VDNEAKPIIVSLIVPILNEEQYIEECIHTLQKQDFPADKLEILLVDGNSTDNTMQILKRLEAEDPEHIRVFTNPKRIQASAMNIGAGHARGIYLMRIDAHAVYPPNYISTCISLIEQTGAVNAGCACCTRSRTKTGNLIAKILTSPFGVGGSQFRLGTKSGYVDTVPFGTFRKDYFLKIGGFDERLARSEDNEINYRIRKLGGKIYMTSDVQVTYYCRDTVRGLAKMAFNNGKWNVIAAKLCPGSMSLKYFVPLAFTLSLIVMPFLCLIHPLFCWAFVSELFLYILLSLYFAAKKSSIYLEVIKTACLFPAFHVPYGIGSIFGIFDILIKQDFRKSKQK